MTEHEQAATPATEEVTTPGDDYPNTVEQEEARRAAAGIPDPGHPHPAAAPEPEHQKGKA